MPGRPRTLAPMPDAVRPLAPEQFASAAIQFAPALLGTILQRRIGRTVRRARLGETEAYLGPADLASHSSKGRTRRTEVMFGPPGRAYVYIIYGLHPMLNVVVGRQGEAEAVLLRAAEPLDGWEADLSGPGRLARSFGVTLEDNGAALNHADIHLLTDAGHRPRIVRRKRVGVDYAGRWKDRLLRFVDASSPVAGRLKP